jgi:hypothetical protein
MFLRYEPVAPYASLGLAISVLLIKPGLLPLPFTWAEVFPAMDSAAPEYFVRLPDQADSFVPAYVVLCGLLLGLAQYCSVAMSQKSGVTYSAFHGEQTNRGMKGAATFHKVFFGLFHCAVGACILAVVITTAGATTDEPLKAAAIALGCLWTVMGLHFLCTAYDKGLKTCLDMLSFAYSCGLYTCFVAGRLGFSGAVSLASTVGCVYAPLLFILLQYSSTCNCRAWATGGCFGGKGSSGGPATRPQPPKGWRGGRGLV